MAKITSPIRAEGKEYVIVAGSFAPNGSGAVSAASNEGAGWSVARTSAGLFTITFHEAYPDMISGVACLQLASADDKYCQVGVYTQASKTLTIRVFDASGGAVDDVSANANNRINFICIFRRTGLTA